jgi:L-ascorbate metabolism protein UlaG (beta-lactamase superfamily)
VGARALVGTVDRAVDRGGRGLSVLRLTHIGGPTVLLEVDGWRILSDPTFDPPGRKYGFGWGTSSTKLDGPACPSADLGAIDLVLVSHDHHADNLDDAGRALLPAAGAVVSTRPGAARLGGGVRGLAAWEQTVVKATDRPPITITATPCRHGPPLSHAIVGEVVGFALDVDGRDGTIWFSGDTVLHPGVREVAGRFDVDVAVMHLGDVRFPVTGPISYSMTAHDAVELCGLVRPRVMVPVHFEGWSHFHEGPSGVRETFAIAPPGVRERVRIVERGEPVDLS